MTRFFWFALLTLILVIPFGETAALLYLGGSLVLLAMIAMKRVSPSRNRVMAVVNGIVVLLWPVVIAAIILPSLEGAPTKWRSALPVYIGVFLIPAFLSAFVDRRLFGRAVDTQSSQKRA